MQWSQMSNAGKVFTVLTAVITLVGMEYVFFHGWMASPWINKLMSIVTNLIVIAILIRIVKKP